MYSKKEAMEILGMSSIRLRQWMAKGYAPYQKRLSKGHKFWFTREDLYQTEVMMQLVEGGMHHKAASEMAKNALDDDVAGVIVITEEVREKIDKRCNADNGAGI